MTVLFLLENSPDFPAGGTDISSHHLARLLRKKRVRVVEWSPYLKRRIPIWYTSIILLLFLVLITVLKCRRESVDIIHVQGKYLIPVGVIAARILNIRVVATIRDYVICCPTGFCLFDSVERHNFISYIINEVPRFLKIYHGDEILINRLIRMMILTRAWCVSMWMRWWVKQAEAVIAVSAYVQSVLKMYAIPSRVIYNCFDATTHRQVMIEKTSRKSSDGSTVLFVGKDSYGKGSDLFDSIAKKKEFSDYRFVKLTTDKWTPYDMTLRAMRDALVVVVPSLWQEPFGRVAMESLMVGTPVVATKQGGLPEIVDDGKTGVLADPTIPSLTHALRVAVENNQCLRTTIRHMHQSLQQRFSRHPVDQHITIYREVLDKIRHR